MSTFQWSEAVVKAIDRAFFEVVESPPFMYGADPNHGAIAGLAAIEDHEVPAHNRMDLLIARNATRIDAKVLRAIARLFASSQLPERAQVVGDQSREAEDEGPTDILQYLEQQAAAGTPFRKDLDVELTDAVSLKPRTRTRRAVPLDERTITSVHIRTLRVHAETLCEHDLVVECDQALGPPMDPLVWAMNLRRRLAGHYNALILDGITPMGEWTAQAWRQVALASARFFDEFRFQRRMDSDDDPEYSDDDPDGVAFDPIAEAKALIRDVRPEDVPWDGRADLHLVQTATSYDLATLRAMGRLWSYALHCRLRGAEAELGRASSERQSQLT